MSEPPDQTIITPPDTCTKCRYYWNTPTKAHRTGRGSDLEVVALYNCERCGYSWFQCWPLDECRVVES